MAWLYRKGRDTLGELPNVLADVKDIRIGIGIGMRSCGRLL
jgi:hypothetical protein